MKTVAVIVSLLFWLIATGLFLTSMMTDFWFSSRLRHFGLFNNCPGGVCSSIGWNLDPDSRYFTIVIPRIIMLAGAGFIAIGLLFGFIFFVLRKSCTLVAEGSFYIVGGIVILGGCGTFTGLFFQTEESLEATSPFHYSFYFGWISGLLYIVAGSCTVVRGLSKYD